MKKQIKKYTEKYKELILILTITLLGSVGAWIGICLGLRMAGQL